MTPGFGNRVVSFRVIKDEEHPEDAPPLVNPEVRHWLNHSSLRTVLIGPGSIYSSMLSQLGLPGFVEALAEVKDRSIPVYWVINHVNTEETSNYTLVNYIKNIERVISRWGHPGNRIINRKFAKHLSNKTGRIFYSNQEGIFVDQEDRYFIRVSDIISGVIINRTPALKVDERIRKGQDSRKRNQH